MRVIYNNTYFVVGKDATHNWKIILDAEKDHYWLHAEGVPSSHIIIEIDEPLESEFLYACELCKNQTKSNIKRFVTTQIKNIKLGSKAGQVYFKDKTKTKLIELN
jgi:predicted ribosome quality control (RQC) complex YloA/Tae2 family protein